MQNQRTPIFINNQFIINFNMQDEIFNMLIQKDEITWQTIIYDLVRTEKLDPWDVDISLLSKKYLETIQRLKQHNFFISGKVLLASAILLKIKTLKLLTEYIADFDNQLFQQNEQIFDESQDPVRDHIKYDIPPLLIKTPQARKRQLTLNDLMGALEKALEIEERRKARYIDRVIAEAVIPEKKIDISELIKTVYEKVINLFKTKERLTFSELVNSDKKEDKIVTFVPLLHLDSQQKIDLKQDLPFGEIEISLMR